MKITLLTPSCGSNGGAETHTEQLNRILRKLGHEVTFLGPSQCVIPASRLPKPAHAIGASIAKRLPGWPHFDHADLVLSTDLMGEGVTHPRHLHVLMGSYSGFRRDAVAPASSLWRKTAQRVMTRHATWLEVRAGRSLGALAPSTGLRERLLPLGLNLRAEVIPPPLDTEAFKTQDQSAAKAELNLPAGNWLLFAGRWEYAKGADRAQELAPRLPAGWKILVAGHGLPTGWYADKRIYSLGAVPASRMPLLFSAANVTFLPSRFEGSSLVVAESLASGTPVLTTTTGSGTDLLNSGTPLGKGVVAEPTSEAWLAALDGIMGEGSTLNEIARTYAHATYGLDSVTEKWESLLLTLKDIK